MGWAYFQPPMRHRLSSVPCGSAMAGSSGCRAGRAGPQHADDVLDRDRRRRPFGPTKVDMSAHHVDLQLWLEATLRKTAVPLTDPTLTVATRGWPIRSRTNLPPSGRRSTQRTSTSGSCTADAFKGERNFVCGPEPSSGCASPRPRRSASFGTEAPNRRRVRVYPLGGCHRKGRLRPSLEVLVASRGIRPQVSPLAAWRSPHRIEGSG
jgi:hypothetical protein